MKRVLLTGATGFIGRNCLPLLLASGFQIHAVSSKLRENNLQDIYWHQADLLDSGQITKLIADTQPTHLLHLAWYAVPGNYWTSLENIRWVRASLDLLQAFVSNGGQRVVMAGTCAEYDWRYGYCSESVTPLLPSTLYGTCKHSLQMMLSAFSKETGMSSAWGRIFSLYGPYEHPDRLVSSVINSLLQGRPARCTHGNQIRDFLHVQDIANAFALLLDTSITGPVNIASGQPVALREVIRKIGEKLNKIEQIHLNALETTPGDPNLLVADVRRLTNEVGWRPKYDLDLGLEQTIQWWRHSLIEANPNEGNLGLKETG
jgi:nucleoside-diphosphate-sugar epimerase